MKELIKEIKELYPSIPMLEIKKLLVKHDMNKEEVFREIQEKGVQYFLRCYI